MSFRYDIGGPIRVTCYSRSMQVGIQLHTDYEKKDNDYVEKQPAL